ncbi:MAG: circularly permuted type 2 ATP-grasp protein [Gammaproteobacteria bacterium]
MYKADKAGVQFYATQLGAYDEMYSAHDQVLPHWKQFMDALEQLGREELDRRRREAHRMLLENGVTYNVYGDALNRVRPWQLDPIPLLIASNEWEVIESGLIQRAELLDLVLADIYGPQKLIKKGLLPLELIYGHQGFLRPCVGTLTKPRQLIIYSANLARGPDGRMWVMDDRTQAPSGAGYALENRTVMTRILPSLFRDSHVHRLAVFFRALRAGLAHIAPHNKDDPRIVVLTPGPFNETYFEHAYLAAYLGYTLAQGDDLTVRDHRVWLKSLQGLQPVDVILRRVDDSFCDPLELRSDSRLGIAGLLEVVRRGNVAMANPLGSSVLENAGLLAFLPGLARYFLGEDLSLPSVATWWCGQRAERDFVLQNLERLVIKPIYRSYEDVCVFGAQLSARERQLWRDRIRAKPHLYVGQEQVSFSTAPSLVSNRIEPRNAILRAFIVAREHGFVAMPGGLTRIAPHKGTLSVSNQAGGVSKDTWVLASEPEKQISLWLQPRRDQLIQPITGSLPSQAADNLFWVGRYLERAEAAARLLRTIVWKLRDTLEYGAKVDIACLQVLLRALTHVTATYPGFIDANSDADLSSPQRELLSIAKDAERQGSIAATIQTFAHVAFSLRNLWSLDTWRTVCDIQRRWERRVVRRQLTVEELQDQLNDLITRIVAFGGLTNDSMAREHGWLMLETGRRLERALQLLALLRATVVQRYEESLQNQVLEAVLTSTESSITYRWRYRSFLQLPTLLDLLIMDESHPRSVVFQLQLLHKHVSDLPREPTRERLSEEERMVLSAYSDVRLADILALVKADNGDGIYVALDELLVNTTQRLWRTSEVISQTYFTHAQNLKQMVPIQLGYEM